MTLEGAINFHETDSYIIYTMNSATTGQYCVVLPKNTNGVMNMLVDLHMKGSFDQVSGGMKTKEQLVEEVSKEYLGVKGKYSNAMLVFPMMDESVLQNAVVNNDKQKMFDEVKKIGAITSEIYKKLTDSGVAKQNIDQKIIIVEKNDIDDKFVMWLKEQMPNFVDGIRYSELESGSVAMNPFMANGVAEPSSVVSEASVNPIPAGNSIFDSPAVVPSVAPVVPEPVVAPAPVMEPSDVVAAQNPSVDIFGIPNNVSGVAPTVEPVVPSSVSENANIGVTSVPNPAPVFNGAEVVNTNPSVQSVPNSVPSVEVPQPQPVQSVGLDGTTTFSPLPNANAVPNDAPVAEVEEEPKNGSKGFVNLIILAAILVGVTIASIELGKFLYSVYGA